jgi:hypothetical protein
MTCPIYELDDTEVTLVNASFLLIDNATIDLRCLIGGLSLESPELRAKVTGHLARLDTAINNLRPLVTHLFELQKAES